MRFTLCINVAVLGVGIEVGMRDDLKGIANFVVQYPNALQVPPDSRPSITVPGQQ